jgi:hypothetical protein
MAYREQMVDRVIILDVDLHHGSEYGSVREGGWSSAASLGRVVRRHLASTWSGEASSIDEPAS